MIIARAPFRIPLGGGGTDLPSYYEQFGGYVLSAAINKYIYLYVNRQYTDDYIRVRYSKYEQVSSLEEIQHDLVKPALQELNFCSNIEIVSMTDIPAGTGMGSSSVYLVALLTALHEIKRDRISVKEIAEQAYYIEHDLAKHPVGKQDHFVSAFGGINKYYFRLDGTVDIYPAGISNSTLEEFKNTVLLYYTGNIRSSREILAEQKEGTLNGNESIIDSLHFTKELGHEITQSLQNGNLETFGLLLHKHWENKKLRSNKMSNPVLDSYYELARENGALGGKLMGAGGGGFFMFYVPYDKKTQFRKVMKETTMREMPYDFDFQGAKTTVNI